MCGMSRLRLRSWIGWIGITLVLLNLLAPGVSHALRRVTSDSGGATLAGLDLCSVPDPRASDRATGTTGTTSTTNTTVSDLAIGLEACGFCADAPMASALPSTPDSAARLGEARQALPQRPQRHAPVPVWRLVAQPRGPPATS